jgi:hypothetical protein
VLAAGRLLLRVQLTVKSRRPQRRSNKLPKTIDSLGRPSSHAVPYHPNNWSGKPNGAGYLEGLRSLRPDVQRRAAELFATLDPRVSKVEEQFAGKYGWTPNRAKRVWETNPGYKTSSWRP